MAKKSSVNKNKRREKMAKQYAAKRAVLKAMAVDDKLSPEERFGARLKLAKLPRNSSPTRIRNRCEITGRPRAVYRKFKLSRLALRQLASLGALPGVVKSSW
jgi:small subunit ribosomal protein S14